MTKNLTLIALLNICSFGLNAQIGSWTSKASLSFSRSTHVGFTLNGKGYICAGATASSNLKDLWQYDPSSNSWSQKADMPGDPRQELSSFVIGNYAYVGHGRNTLTSEIFNSFNRYDPSTNSWSAIADCPVERFTSTGFSIDSIGYVTCGINSSRFKDLYAYNPITDKWTQKASLPSTALNRSFACVASVNHKAYLMGGFEGQIMKDFYEYDPSTDIWTAKTDYPGGARYTAAGLTLGNYVLMGLGKDASNTDYKDWYYYNPSNDTWTKMKDYPADNVGGHATFVINGKGYVCAGTNKASDIRNYLYELSANALSIEPITEKIENKLKPYIGFGSSVLYCNTFKGQFKVVVYNIWGKEVFSQMEYTESGQQKSFNLSHLPKGIYVAHFDNASIERTFKITLE